MKFKQITDGLSKTLGFAETVQGQDGDCAVLGGAGPRVSRRSLRRMHLIRTGCSSRSTVLIQLVESTMLGPIC